MAVGNSRRLAFEGQSDPKRPLKRHSVMILEAQFGGSGPAADTAEPSRPGAFPSPHRWAERPQGRVPWPAASIVRRSLCSVEYFGSVFSSSIALIVLADTSPLLGSWDFKKSLVTRSESEGCGLQLPNAQPVRQTML